MCFIHKKSIPANVAATSIPEKETSVMLIPLLEIPALALEAALEADAAALEAVVGAAPPVAVDPAVAPVPWLSTVW